MRKKLLWWGVVLLVIVTVAGYSYWRHAQQTNKKSDSVDTAVAVKVVNVRYQTVPISIHSVGVLQARQQVTLSAQVPGTIVKLGFHEGREVKKGTPLLWLDPRIYQSQLQAAKAKLAIDKLTYQRNKKLGKKGVVPQQKVDQKFADYQHQQALAAKAQTELDETTVTAPFSGRLDVRHVNIGQYVTAGDPLVTLVDDTHLHVDYHVPAKYLPQLTLGQQVIVKSGGKRYSGKVIFISPLVDSNTGSVEVQANLPNDRRQLAPGQYVQVTQLIDKKRSLVVPNRALLPSITGQKVYRVINNKAISTPVSIAGQFNNLVAITKGLKAGDIVVTDGQQKLKEGMQVKRQGIIKNEAK